MDDDERSQKQVVEGSPAPLFENFEVDLEQDAQPFKARPMPIGGSRRGIPNKRTVALRDLYLKMGMPHPILAMGALLRLGVDGLARELKCSLVDAAEYYRKIASDVAPYIEGKQPTRVDVTGMSGLPLVIVGDVGAARQAVDAARAEGALAIDDDIEPALVEFQRNQGVKTGAAATSQAEASHDDAKPLT